MLANFLISPGDYIIFESISAFDCRDFSKRFCNHKHVGYNAHKQKKTLLLRLVHTGDTEKTVLSIVGLN